MTRRVDWALAGLVAFGLAALGSGVYRFALHGGLSLRNGIQAGIGLALACVFLVVSDFAVFYLYGFRRSVFAAVAILAVAFRSAAFSLGLGLALLGILAMQRAR